MDLKWYQWYIEVIKKYTAFNGRASRSEFWYFALMSCIIAVPIIIVDIILHTSGVLIILYDLFIILPALAVTVRRLHDIGKSGWWILIDLIPFIGFIVLLVFEATDSQPSSNQFGENPKGVNNNNNTTHSNTVNPESVSNVSIENGNSNNMQDTQSYKFCPKCGYRNNVSDNFCKQCGAKLI